jgi:hypothetical protein
MYHHVGLPSSQNQNQNPTPTFVPPQTIPPSFPTHNYQQQPQSYSQPVATFQNPETNQNFMSKLSEILEKNNKFFSEIDEKYKQQKEESQRILDEKLQASRLALQEKLQQISDKYTKLKKSRNNIVVEKNSEKVEEKQETEFITSVTEQEETEILVVQEPPHKTSAQIPKTSTEMLTSSINSRSISMLFSPSLELGNKKYELLPLPATSPPVPPSQSSENVLSPPASPPPPPKPPDLLKAQSLPFSPKPLTEPPITSPCPRPPPKPNYGCSRWALVALYLYYHEYRTISKGKPPSTSISKFPPLDQLLTSSGKSWPFDQNVILVKPPNPTKTRQVSEANLSTTIEALLTHVMQQSLHFARPHYCSSTWLAVFYKSITGFNSKQQLEIQLWALFKMGQLFYHGQIFMNKKNHVPQISPHTRPARKPPDLHLNLEDKVQVNPAAMIDS